MRFFSHDPGDLTSPEARAHPLAFYRQFFAGWTPEDLSARAPIVYERLRRKGLLRLVPRIREQTPPPFGGDPLAYYRQHYAGLTRGQVRDQEPGLYKKLRLAGLLAYIPLKPRIRFDDPVAYYREHCAGMTRKQAALAEPQFYSYLQRHRLLDTIPFAASDGADRDVRPPAPPPDTSPTRQTAKPAKQRQLRPPSLDSARLGSFRIIPE